MIHYAEFLPKIEVLWTLTALLRFFYMVNMDAKLIQIDTKIWLATKKPPEAHHQAPINLYTAQINACG